MPEDLVDNNSTLIRVMGRYCQATGHYMKYSCLRSLMAYGVTKPQWVNQLFILNYDYSFVTFHNELLRHFFIMAGNKNIKLFFPVCENSVKISTEISEGNVMISLDNTSGFKKALSTQFDKIKFHFICFGNQRFDEPWVIPLVFDELLSKALGKNMTNVQNINHIDTLRRVRDVFLLQAIDTFPITHISQTGIPVTDSPGGKSGKLVARLLLIYIYKTQ